MNVQGWCRRLEKQLPGWHVWRAGSGGTPGTAGWYAVPAPSDITNPAAHSLPHRIGPYQTPQALREAARDSYGWDDHCQSCGAPWQECGHRTPETRVQA